MDCAELMSLVSRRDLLLTMTLAEQGMNAGELRKLLGLTFLRVFRQSVG
jgi:hypothetical protein